MGRKRKMPINYVQEFPLDLKLVKNEKENEDRIMCIVCLIEINLQQNPKARIKEHLHSARHQCLRKMYKGEEGTIILNTTVLKDDEVEEAAVSQHFAISSLTAALVFAGLPHQCLDGGLRDFLIEHCPTVRLSESGYEIMEKHLPDVFESQKKELIGRSKGAITITIYETVELMDRPTICVFLAFYDSRTNSPRTVLASIDLLLKANSVTISTSISNALRMIDKDWTELLGVCGPSADYMKKAYTELKAGFNLSLLSFPDPGHLVDFVVAKSLELDMFADVIYIVSHFPLIFYDDPKMAQIYFSYCIQFGLNEKELKLPPIPLPSNWCSWYLTALEIMQKWSCVVMLLQSEDLDGLNNQKLRYLQEKMTESHIIYTKLAFLVENLNIAFEFINKLESTKIPLIVMISEMINNITQRIEECCQPNFLSFGEKTCAAFNIAGSSQEKLKAAFSIFYTFVNNQWKELLAQDEDLNIYGNKGFWACCSMFNPYHKNTVQERLPKFFKLTMLHNNKEPDVALLSEEWERYRSLPVPEVIKDLIEYWHQQENDLPNLSAVALQLLSVPVSVKAHRFALKKLQQFKNYQEASNREILKMMYFMNFNQDLSM